MPLTMSARGSQPHEAARPDTVVARLGGDHRRGAAGRTREADVDDGAGGGRQHSRPAVCDEFGGTLDATHRARMRHERVEIGRRRASMDNRRATSRIASRADEAATRPVRSMTSAALVRAARITGAAMGSSRSIAPCGVDTGVSEAPRRSPTMTNTSATEGSTPIVEDEGDLLARGHRAQLQLSGDRFDTPPGADGRPPRRRVRPLREGRSRLTVPSRRFAVAPSVVHQLVGCSVVVGGVGWLWSHGVLRTLGVGPAHRAPGPTGLARRTRPRGRTRWRPAVRGTRRSRHRSLRLAAA